MKFIYILFIIFGNISWYTLLLIILILCTARAKCLKRGFGTVMHKRFSENKQSYCQ